jgi:hypothetical protein
MFHAFIEDEGGESLKSKSSCSPRPTYTQWFVVANSPTKYNDSVFGTMIVGRIGAKKLMVLSVMEIWRKM